MDGREAIKAVMAIEKVSQAKLAEQFGVTQTAVSKSVKRNMRIDTFVKFMSAMGYEVVVRKDNHEIIVNE